MDSNYVTQQATSSTAIPIPAHSSVAVPLTLLMAATPGDNPESIQFVAANGAKTLLPVARRTLIPSTGGAFQTLITGTVGRQVGQISTYWMNVPAGTSSLNVTFSTADAQADNKFKFYLINPAGTAVSTDTSPKTVNGAQVGTADVHYSVPGGVPAGVWEIDVVLTLTVSGNEFTQTVFGDVTAAGSEAIDTTVTQQGALTLSVPNAAPVVLPTPVLTGDGSSLISSGTMNPVTITDTRQSSPGWNAAGQVTAFTNLGGSGTIPAADLGWVPFLIDQSPGETVVPAAAVAPQSPGLAASEPLASAAAGMSNGTAHVGAALNLLAPTSTGLGTYSATLTLTAI
jgi:hypothetical protein